MISKPTLVGNAIKLYILAPSADSTEVLSDLALDLLAATVFIEASALDSVATGSSWLHQTVLCG